MIDHQTITFTPPSDWWCTFVFGTQKRTSRLSTEDEDGDDGDEEEDDDEEEDEDDVPDAPPGLMRKIDALKKLHEKALDVDAEYKKERIALENKYRELKKPIYHSQSQIVSGEVDVPAEEGPDPSSEDAEGEAVKGIPGYWAQALINHPAVQEIVSMEDMPAMEAITDIKCTYNEDYTSFTLTFHFAENEYFTNQVRAREDHVHKHLVYIALRTINETRNHV